MHCSYLANVVFQLQFVKGDIQSMDLLSFVLQTEEIDTIMHFAAQVSFSWGHVVQWYKELCHITT